MSNPHQSPTANDRGLCNNGGERAARIQPQSWSNLSALQGPSLSATGGAVANLMESPFATAASAAFHTPALTPSLLRLPTLQEQQQALAARSLLLMTQETSSRRGTEVIHPHSNLYTTNLLGRNRGQLSQNEEKIPAENLLARDCSFGSNITTPHMTQGGVSGYTTSAFQEKNKEKVARLLQQQRVADDCVRRQSEWVHALRSEVARRRLAGNSREQNSKDITNQLNGHQHQTNTSPSQRKRQRHGTFAHLPGLLGAEESSRSFTSTNSILQSPSLSANKAAPPTPPLAPGQSRRLTVPSDKAVLSEYQLLIRESIEIFATSPTDILWGVPGRQKSVAPGQVGIRCRYCAHRPAHWRGRGATYYPGTVAGLYQSAQNMATNHFLTSCQEMPVDIREKFQASRKKQEQESRRGFGKSYWIETCRQMNLEERDGMHGVWFGKEDRCESFRERKQSVY